MIVAVYKEEGLTSRDLVNRIKDLTGEKKVGHAGTLDPLASGVLVVGVGRSSTRKLHTSLFFEKDYTACIKLGESSSTDDREGKLVTVNENIPPAPLVASSIDCFIGETMQKPPIYSAIKIKGKEAYKYARKGISVLLPERKINIKRISILNYNYPFVNIQVTTGKGVYIRSLARDIGEKLQTGGYLYALERTRVGEFSKEDCVALSFFENFKNYANIS